MWGQCVTFFSSLSCHSPHQHQGHVLCPYGRSGARGIGGGRMARRAALAVWRRARPLAACGGNDAEGDRPRPRTEATTQREIDPPAARGGGDAEGARTLGGQRQWGASSSEPWAAHPPTAGSHGQSPMQRELRPGAPAPLDLWAMRPCSSDS
jgi:hypothetical protein